MLQGKASTQRLAIDFLRQIMGENIKIGIIETMGLPVRPIPISNRCKVLKKF